MLGLGTEGAFILFLHITQFLNLLHKRFQNLPIAFTNLRNEFTRGRILLSWDLKSLQWQQGDIAITSARILFEFLLDSILHNAVKESDFAKCCWNLGSSNLWRVTSTQWLSKTNSSRVSALKFFIVVKAYTPPGSTTGLFKISSFW